MPFFSKGCVQLKRYIKKLDIDQKKFADAADIAPDFLSHLLRGRKRPSLDTAFRIEEASRGEVDAKLWTTETTPPV